MADEIITVTGPIAPDQLGYTLSHEHLLIDMFAFRGSYSDIIDEEKVVIQEVEHYLKAGGCSLVDCTYIGLGRGPEAAKGIAHVGLATGVPTTFGVITADTLEQAVERAGAKAGNKGADAAMSAVEMVNLTAQLKS